MHPPSGELNEEERVKGLQASGLHAEEVAGQDAGGLLSEKLFPGRTLSPWGWGKSMAAKERAMVAAETKMPTFFSSPWIRT
jgi:hypothetical protein